MQKVRNLLQKSENSERFGGPEETRTLDLSDANAYIRVTPAVYHGYKNYITSGEFANGGFSEKVINGACLRVAFYHAVPVFTSLLGVEIHPKILLLAMQGLTRSINL